MHGHLIIPSSIAQAIRSSGVDWGSIDLKNDQVESLHIVSGYSETDRLKRSNIADWLKEHYSKGISPVADVGFWYRARRELHVLGRLSRARDLSVKSDAFRGYVNGFRAPTVDRLMPVITFCDDPGSGTPEWMAWEMNSVGATPVTLEVIDEAPDLLAPLDPAWPRRALEEELVTIIGVGSIGSSVAEALSEYSIRKFALVDPDRLHMRNFARHRASPSEVGRLKVNAVESMLRDRDPGISVERYPIDIVESADLVRPLLVRSSLAVVCVDGVAARRTANHLACRARTTVILACVLDDGRIGEVMRVVPGHTACLLCSREALIEAGAMSPEASIDLGYGTGTRHRPMTAVGGDLDLVGKFAAKVAIATLLEQAGFREQRLPGDQAVIGLRPTAEVPPAPFDVHGSGAVSWHSLGAPKPACPSCGSRE